MKTILAISALMLAISLPAFAQWGQRRLSPDDQRRFDSYYERWQQYRQTNNRGEMSSMEKRMQDIYQHYGIPANTPYGRVAAGGGGGYWDGDRDRGGDRDRDRDRDWNRGPGWGRNDYRARFSPNDQSRFDSYYSRWLQYRRTNNRDQIASMEKRMWDLMDRNNVPRSVPFSDLASRRY
jgi:hypothetical protein